MKKDIKKLSDQTDVKVLILYILDEMNHPATYSAIVDAILDVGCIRGFDFAECFSELSEFGHILSDTVGGETYYMIAESGSMVARELRGSLPVAVLERASVAAARHLALSKMGVVLHASVSPTEQGNYRVDFHIDNGNKGNMLSLGVNVATKERADKIKAYCESARAEDIYRGILTVITGDINYYL